VQSAEPVSQSELLIHPGRFGASLHRARSQSGGTLAALARDSDNRWLPDQLVRVERGLAPLGEDDVRALVVLYGLPRRPMVPAARLELVLDRSAMSDFDAEAHRDNRGDARTHEEIVATIARRFIAVAVLVGLDLASGPIGIESLAEAMEASRMTAVDFIKHVMESDAAAIGVLITDLADRVVVPEAGYLVAESAVGSLVLARRGGSDPDGPLVDPCGTLAELFDAAR